MVSAAKTGIPESFSVVYINPSINGRKAVFLASERNRADNVKLLIKDGRVQPTLFRER